MAKAMATPRTARTAVTPRDLIHAGVLHDQVIVLPFSRALRFRGASLARGSVSPRRSLLVIVLLPGSGLNQCTRA